LQWVPGAVTATSMLSPAAAELPDALEAEQLWLPDVTLHESNVLPVVLSMTATVASSELSVTFVSAYRSVTVAPPRGVGPASSGLLEKPVVAAGHLPLPCPASSV